MVVVTEKWWAFVLRGIAAVLFGVITFIMPGMALLTLVLLFGFYATMDGAFNIAAAFRKPEGDENQPWWALLIQGLAGLVAGALAIFVPAITAVALVYLIAGWAMVTGIMAIVAAVRLRKQIQGEWLLVLAGVLSIVFSLMIGLFPARGALALVLWIGAYSIAFGILLISLGVRLRRHARGHDAPATPHVAPLASSN